MTRRGARWATPSLAAASTPSRRWSRGREHLCDRAARPSIARGPPARHGAAGRRRARGDRRCRGRISWRANAIRRARRVATPLTCFDAIRGAGDRTCANCRSWAGCAPCWARLRAFLGVELRDALAAGDDARAAANVRCHAPRRADPVGARRARHLGRRAGPPAPARRCRRATRRCPIASFAAKRRRRPDARVRGDGRAPRRAGSRDADPAQRRHRGARAHRALLGRIPPGSCTGSSSTCDA